MEYQSTVKILPETQKKRPWRALIAYWILGLCNNYGYVVMLTAASDIIGENEGSKSKDRNCSYMSTGAILLADIIPSLLAKFLAPFFPFFVKNVISTWSSGTGGAGVIGALSYSLLAALGFQKTLLVMLLVPAIMGATFYILLPTPDTVVETDVQNEVNNEELENPKEALKKKFKQVPSLFKYMIPFGLVYFLEYFINQGTFELVNFKNVFLNPNEQYRWLQVAYQVGVFLSRSSVNFFHIRHIWILSVLQAINVAIFTTEVVYYYMPSFWIMVALTLWEGLLGGAAYVNTYYRISTEVEESKRQFSMAITGFADSMGITIAGITAIYAHNAICSLPLY